jgi:hypothetical protein
MKTRWEAWAIASAVRNAGAAEALEPGDHAQPGPDADRDRLLLEHRGGDRHGAEEAADAEPTEVERDGIGQGAGAGHVGVDQQDPPVLGRRPGEAEGEARRTLPVLGGQDAHDDAHRGLGVAVGGGVGVAVGAGTMGA